MKKIIKILLLISASILLIACGDTNADGDNDSESTFKVGYVINTLNDTFPTMVMNAANEKADELGIDFELQDAENDLIRQQDQVESLIQNGVDALIVVPADTSGMDPIAQTAVEADVPLVFLDNNPYVDNPEDIPEGVYVVSTDEREAGQMQAKYIVEELGGEGGVAILMGGLGHESSFARTEGIKDVLEDEYPDIEVLAEDTAEWQKDLAVNLVENWVLTYGEALNAIFANNDEMALGAAQALKMVGREDVFTIGIDATAPAKDAINNGELSATIFQDAEGLGYNAVEILNKHLNGEELPEQTIFIDFDLVLPENVLVLIRF